MATGLIIAIGCAMAALLYGVISIKWIVALPTGNERIRELAEAVKKRLHRVLETLERDTAP